MSFHRETMDDEIRTKAHEIYERSGRIEGKDLDNWIEAEQIVFARHTEKVSWESFNGMLFDGSEY